MSFINLLQEKLESQETLLGLKDRYETNFKVDGQTFVFRAQADSGDIHTAPRWKLFVGHISNERLDGVVAKDILKAFVDATLEFVKTYNPKAFYMNTGFPYDELADGLVKAVKGYNVVDQRKEVDAPNGEKIEGVVGGDITFTKEEEKPYADFEAKLDDNKKTFDKYELPKDITIKKDHTTFPKSDSFNLDNKKAYEPKTESFQEFKNRMLNEELGIVD